MKTPNVEAAKELDCMELETISSGKGPGPNGENRSEFVAGVIAWKRRVGMPVLIPGY